MTPCPPPPSDLLFRQPPLPRGMPQVLIHSLHGLENRWGVSFRSSRVNSLGCREGACLACVEPPSRQVRVGVRDAPAEADLCTRCTDTERGCWVCPGRSVVGSGTEGRKGSCLWVGCCGRMVRKLPFPRSRGRERLHPRTGCPKASPTWSASQLWGVRCRAAGNQK